MKKLLSIIFFFVFCQLHSQFKQATILFTDNTTIEGFGEIKNNKIYFKVDKDGKADEWTYDDTKGIIFTGYSFAEKYEYVKLYKNSKPELLQLIEEGKVNLYLNVFFTDNSFMVSSGNYSYNSTINRIYYLKRKDEEYAFSFGRNFKKNAGEYFSDCEIMIKKINAKKFTNKNIDEMVTYYNNYCDGENSDNNDE